MIYNQGDIVLVKFPFTDLSETKVRPALVVSNSAVNRSEDYIIVMITTKPINGNLGIEINSKNLDTPLKGNKTSYIYCKKIATLNRSIIQKKISKVKNNILLEVVENIKKIITVE